MQLIDVKISVCGFNVSDIVLVGTRTKKIRSEAGGEVSHNEIISPFYHHHHKLENSSSNVYNETNCALSIHTFANWHIPNHCGDKRQKVTNFSKFRKSNRSLKLSGPSPPYWKHCRVVYVDVIKPTLSTCTYIQNLCITNGCGDNG